MRRPRPAGTRGGALLPRAQPPEQQVSAHLTRVDQILLKGPGYQGPSRFASRQGRTESSPARPTVIAPSLLEPEGAPKKHLRVKLPPGHACSRHPRGRRRQRPGAEPYVICFSNGCSGQTDVTHECSRTENGAEFGGAGDKLQGARSLCARSRIAKAYARPADRSEGVRRNQKKLQEELQNAPRRRARVEATASGTAAVKPAAK